MGAVWGRQHRNHLFLCLNRHLWLCIVSPDLIAVQFIALGVVGVVSPSDDSS